MSNKFLRILTATVIISLALFGIAGADAWQTVGTSYYLNPGHSLYATGASGFNFSAATGIFKMPSGVFTMTNGAAIPANKDITMTAGTGKIIVGTGGINATSGRLGLLRSINVSNLGGESRFYSSVSFYAPISILGTAGLTAGGDVSAVRVNSSGISTLNALAVTTTSTFTQQATMTQALAVTARNLNADYNETLNGVKDGAIFMDCAAANKTVILRTPAAMGSGALITIKAVTGPASGYLKVTTLTNGTNTISGAKMWISTDDVHLPAITLMSNGGTSYWVVSTYGNWTTTTK